ncbi:MAG: response regulator [Desulfobacteraceae bacterium]|nr:response regulator [Desulfobacteraceae bacterium]
MSEKKILKSGLGPYPKVLILMLIISLGSLSLLFFPIYSEITHRIQQDTQILMSQTTNSLLNNIDEWLDKNVRALRAASKQSAITTMDASEQIEILQNIRAEYPWIYLVFTLDKEGKNLARSDQYALKDYSDRKYFLEVKQGKLLSWQTLRGKTSQKSALVLAVPVIEKGKFVGVLAAAMTIDTISNLVATWPSGKSGFAFLLDENNKILAHPEKKYVQEERNFGQHPMVKANKNGSLGFQEFAGENQDQKIGLLKKNQLGWSLVLELGKTEAYRELYKFQKFMYLVFVSIVFMVFILAWFFAKVFVSPIIEMSRVAQKRQNDLEIRLKKVRKMEAIGTFAGGIAHDFNNILGAITTCSEMAIEDVEEKNPAHEDLKHILKAAIRGKKLVKQILEYSRSRNTKREPVKLHRIILECLDLFKSFKPAGIQIKLDIASKFDFIPADPTQIHQVIMNLLLNAEHAMGGQVGILTISLKRVDSSKNKIPALEKLAKGVYLHLLVSDTGCGMDDHVLERMFDPFYTTHMNTGGTGLGLAMSDVIIKRHKGVITAESELSKGSCFHVFLPCMGEADLFEEAGKTELFVRKGDERILFVDDDENMIYSCSKMLRRLGYQVESRTTARDALVLFKKDPDYFDLIITDRVMPGKTGVAFAHDIRGISKDIPIIMCSGFFNKKDDAYLDIEYDLEGLIDETVSKPFEIKPMSMVIRNVIDAKKAAKKAANKAAKKNG